MLPYVPICHVQIYIGKGEEVFGIKDMKMYIIEIFPLYENVSILVRFQDYQSYIYFL